MNEQQQKKQTKMTKKKQQDAWIICLKENNLHKIQKWDLLKARKTRSQTLFAAMEWDKIRITLEPGQSNMLALGGGWWGQNRRMKEEVDDEEEEEEKEKKKEK